MSADGLPLPFKATRALIVAYEHRQGSIGVGQTVHMNHEGCAAGDDDRERLYVTRKLNDTGSTVDLAYCHNCGRGSAIVPGVIHARVPIALVTGAPLPARELELPAGLVPMDTKGFPHEAAEFLGARVADAELAALGVGYDRETHRLLLPIYRRVCGERGVVTECEDLIGWQSRRLFGSGPKYLTVESDAAAEGGLESMVYLWSDTGPAQMVILVEDWLSAMYVATQCPAAAVVPLFRYKISAERLARLRKSFTFLAVWLDDDKPEVCAEAAHIRSLWAALGGADEASPDRNAGIDPKNRTPDQIRRSYLDAVGGHFLIPYKA